MALVTIVTCVQVVLRYVFNSSIDWAEEFTRYAIIWMSMVGAGMGVRYGKHISVDLLANVLPRAGARYAVALSGLLGLAFALMLVWYAYGLVDRSVMVGQVSSAMQAPMWLIYSILPAGGALLALRCAEFTVHAFTADGTATQLPEGEDEASRRDVDWKGGM
ncbi:MAG: TRAP transporter small permease [Alphaproteobacteria bacterium]|nr:TRAP transporter small permease [Alphaproteobacteria bacterium]